MKQTVFIGCSSEALAAAGALAGHLRGEFDVTIWNERVFRVNDQTLDRILKTIELFDYGVFVLSRDDVARVRWRLWSAPRDNVVLELGIYLGRLGARRAFAVTEEGVKIPSDLAGFTCPRYDHLRRRHRTDHHLREVMRPIADELGGAFRERFSQANLRLLPSTALAIGYFDNFVAAVCDNGVVSVGGRSWNLRRDKCRFIVLVPTVPGHAYHGNVGSILAGCGLQEVEVDAGGARPFPFHVRVDAAGERLEIVDVPTTLAVIPAVVQLHLGKDYLGESPEEAMMIQREFANFSRTLKILLSRPCNERLSRTVAVKDWDGGSIKD